MTCYPEEELLGQSINIFLREEMHEAHRHILEEKSVKINNLDHSENKANIFLKKKDGYYVICDFRSRFMNGSSGRKWLITLTELSSEVGVCICDDKGKVLGFNEKVYCILGDKKVTGQYFDEHFFSYVSNDPICTMLPIKGAPRKPF